MTTMQIDRAVVEQALEALEHHGGNLPWNAFVEVRKDLRAALAQQDEPVAERAFLERILAAMEGVIDVADRKTAEFDALRSCVIDLTVMLHVAPPQQVAQQAEPLNLRDSAVQKRLATQWGYVPAAQQAEPVEPVATLIAQRDALLEALKGLMQQYKDQPECFMDWSKARAAIKAVEETK